MSNFIKLHHANGTYSIINKESVASIHIEETKLMIRLYFNNGRSLDSKHSSLHALLVFQQNFCKL